MGKGVDIEINNNLDFMLDEIESDVFNWNKSQCLGNITVYLPNNLEKSIINEIERLLIDIVENNKLPNKEGIELLRQYDLLEEYDKKMKYCYICDMDKDKLMFIGRTKLLDYHKGKWGFFCKECFYERCFGLGKNVGQIVIT